jgi:hypothetical protein
MFPLRFNILSLPVVAVAVVTQGQVDGLLVGAVAVVAVFFTTRPLSKQVPTR